MAILYGAGNIIGWSTEPICFVENDSISRYAAPCEALLGAAELLEVAVAARSAARAEAGEHAGEAAKAGAARKGGQLEAAEDSEFASLRGYQAGAVTEPRPCRCAVAAGRCARRRR